LYTAPVPPQRPAPKRSPTPPGPPSISGRAGVGPSSAASCACGLGASRGREARAGGRRLGCLRRGGRLLLVLLVLPHAIVPAPWVGGSGHRAVVGVTQLHTAVGELEHAEDGLRRLPASSHERVPATGNCAGRQHAGGGRAAYRGSQIRGSADAKQCLGQRQVLCAGKRCSMQVCESGKVCPAQSLHNSCTIQLACGESWLLSRRRECGKRTWVTSAVGMGGSPARQRGLKLRSEGCGHATELLLGLDYGRSGLG
jgi:hypothetical protein